MHERLEHLADRAGAYAERCGLTLSEMDRARLARDLRKLEGELREQAQRTRELIALALAASGGGGDAA